MGLTRRSFVLQMGKLITGAGALSFIPAAMFAQTGASTESRRPLPADRKFRSNVVEAYIASTRRFIHDPVLAAIFANCFPNTLDTTVEPGTFDGKPDTAVITGDIPAMWLRDSSAQVWPYLLLASKDRSLRDLLEGVIRRQTRCLLIDPYANCFMADLNAPPLEWSRKDRTEMKQGVGERKYELDSLCYPIRLAYGYWKNTGDTAPFNAAWKLAMQTILSTMRVQQRREGQGPYHFQRASADPTDTLVNGIGNPVKPIWPCRFLFSAVGRCLQFSRSWCLQTLFAVTLLLRQLAEMSERYPQ